MYRSGFEKTLALQLTKAKVSFLYEPIELDYTVHHKYKPDFVLPNGIIIEAKGVLNKRDSHETQKMVAVKKSHPDLDIRFVFMEPHNSIPRQKQTHAQWATKNGFPWAGPDIPKEWIDE